jgi:tyrosine decarboxylase
MDFEALFLGPKAENQDFFREILSTLIDEHVDWRTNFHPDDKASITPEDKKRKDFTRTQKKIRDVLLELSAKLKTSSVPFHSPRYVGHMISDILMPAHLAYLLTALYNPNNVAWEGSPATTELELEAGLDLAQMIGFERNEAFGHITSGGTVANMEALWIARNLKSVPFAIREAVPDLVEGRTDKELKNLSPAETLDLLVKAESRIDEIKNHTVRTTGMEFANLGKIFLPQTKHYSWVKAADVLGLGTDALVFVKVTEDYRMDIDDLRNKIRASVESGEPILAVVGVLGSTEESSVDPIDKIVELRNEFEREGVSFYIHVDGAYGGYARSVFLDTKSEFLPLEKLKRALDKARIIPESCDWPGEDVYNAYKALAHVDSVTIDPHKLGYIPYPAGAVVFRDRHVRDFVSYFASYVFESEEVYRNPHLLGSYILEGSKAGAASSAVWTAHNILGLNYAGYGRVIGESIEGAMRFYDQIVRTRAIRAGEKVYRVVPLVKPDINIVVYAFNEEGNDSLEEMNSLNRKIKDRLSYKPERPVSSYEFFVSSTSLDHEEYGDAPLGFLEKCGISKEEWDRVHEVFVIRSCIMSPYMTRDFTDMDYLTELFGCFEKVLIAID